MTDVFDPQKRSEIMRLVHSKNTKPELSVRSVLHSLGYRFRTNRKDLPGSPDIVLPRFGLIILVNGCFWHRHEGCRLSRLPKSNEEYWQKKIDRNVARDEENLRFLKALGWRVLVLWECQISNRKKLTQRIITYFSSLTTTMLVPQLSQLTLLDSPIDSSDGNDIIFLK